MNLAQSPSTKSDDSMVEIKFDSHHRNNDKDEEEQSRHRLLYSKSRVYVHPTAYSRDNIPGFVTIVKRDSISPSYLLAWIPETLLDPDARDDFTRVERERPPGHDDDEDGVLINAPTPHGESYAFSVAITSIYSITATPPTLSSWYGSMSINLVNGSTLPTLYFHDDESRSLQMEQRASPAAPTWGGEDLLQRLRSYAHLLRSSLQPNLFLVDPSIPDIEAHSTPIFDDSAVDLIFSQSSNSPFSTSPVPPLRRPNPPKSLPARYPPTAPTDAGRSVLHQGMPLRSNRPPSSSSSSGRHSNGPPSAGQALLTSFSHITRSARHAAQNILSHPLARPIIPHLPDPVKSLIHVEGEVGGEWSSWVEKGGVGEFESARVYLARWARIVAEQGERARQAEAYSQSTSSASPDPSSPSAGGDTSNTVVSDLGVFELLAATSSLPIPKSTRNPRNPIDLEEWRGWLGNGTDVRPKLRWGEFKKEVFERGFTTPARKKAWGYLLEVVPWEATPDERRKVWEEKKAEYEKIKREWYGLEEVLERDEVVEERHRIDVDCRRTDRTHPIFLNPTTPPGSSSSTPVPEDDDDGDAQSRSNAHVDKLAEILLTYNFYEKELGYVQGMSDLCAPIYVVCECDEARTFWCFVGVMDRMKKNFLRDQSGMKKQLSQLQQLVAVMDPEMYRHLEKTESLNLFFCFRWVLIAFKREFPFEDVLRLWEVLWTDYYTSSFVLFVALAVIESHRDVILRYLVEFDEILKYCNELSMTIELDSTLAQAQVLFLSFQQIVADIDRRHAEQGNGQATVGLRKRKNVSSSSSGAVAGGERETDETVQVALPAVNDELRELLVK